MAPAHRHGVVQASAALLALAGVEAAAEADGPDWLRVTGVAPGHRLTIRAEPSAEAPAIGALPSDVDGIRNGGCRGGLSFAEWQGATPGERETAAEARWCRVTVDGVTGWAAGRFLAEGTAPAGARLAQVSGPATPPSFDCARATAAVERLVCADGELGALDREVARLFGLARVAGPAVERERLTEGERAFLRKRDGCGGEGGARGCVAAAYVGRVAELREGSSAARGQDDAGISSGPFAARCRGFDALIGLTFVNSDPGFLYAAWLDRTLTLRRVPSGSGARYEAADGSGGVWTRGEEALVTLPGRAEMTCAIERIG